MVRKVNVEGYDALMQAINENECCCTILVLFVAAKGPDGCTWCPDCNKAHPVIDELLCQAPCDSVFIECSVGAKECWKDQCNCFRTQLGIKFVPTLMNWHKKWKKLEDEQCANRALVSLFFTDV